MYHILSFLPSHQDFFIFYFLNQIGRHVEPHSSLSLSVSYLVQLIMTTQANLQRLQSY